MEVRLTPERLNQLHGRPPLRTRTKLEIKLGFPPGYEAFLKRTFPNTHPGWFLPDDKIADWMSMVYDS